VPRPVLVCFAGIALLSVMDAVIKEALATLPVFQVAFLRYAVGSCCMTAIVGVARPGWPRADTVRANAVRALLVVVTATCFFYGIGVLPLAEALLLSFMSPFFTAVLAAMLLGEKLGARTFGAIAAGFAGVAVIVAGSHGGEGAGRAAAPILGAMAVLLSALTYSASNVLLRARAQRDPLLHIVLIQNVAPALILAVPAALVWTAPSLREGLLLLAIGTLGVAGHLCLARAYAGAEASRLAPLDYTALIWALGLGFFAFGEIPTPWAAAGASLIFAGVLIGARKA
jgi:drug/metabolite transporter (DMT)-like permease